MGCEMSYDRIDVMQTQQGVLQFHYFVWLLPEEHWACL